MRFAQRNIYYLRASPRVVLQTILHIDPQHLRWMNARPYQDAVVGEEVDADEEHGAGTQGDPAELESNGDEIWARALQHLRFEIMPKLLRESVDGQLLSSSNKKEKTDTHIDKDFQMAFFFRKTTGRHAVLLKEKTLVFPQQSMGPPALSASAVRSHQSTSSMPPSRLAQRQRQEDDVDIIGQGEAIAEERFAGPSGEDALDRATGYEQSLGHSGDFVRKRRYSSPEPESRNVRIKQEEDDDEVVPLEPDVQGEQPQGAETDVLAQAQQPADLDAEEAIDEKKPKLEVSYSGFQIFGKCLVIVIMPTKRARRSRPGLFQAPASREKSQLSATPVPEYAEPADLERGEPSNLRSATPRDSRASIAAHRSDSRRLATPGNSRNGLFRGTPSDWEPTPPPLSRRGSQVPSSPYRHQESSTLPGMREAEANEDTGEESEDEDDQENLASFHLATQMLEGGNMPHQGNDIDDD